MIVLTGASGGIGAALLSVLTEIDHVIGIYNATPPETPESDRLSFEQVDIRDLGAIAAFVEKRKKDLSRVTVVHGAVSSIDGLAAELSESDWDTVMGINLKGNFLLTQALLPAMIAEKWGRIIHLSSVVGTNGVPGTLAYSASKTGLQGMSAVLAREYARFNITSNILVLGYFEVGLIETLSEEQRKDIVARIPGKKLGAVSNIAEAVAFLVRSDYTNAAVINLDGGL
ncbi:MAG: SDR family NAD(P)-dependent oxidoreductase [Alphaproteobacteria bacterium]|nr:SDR family NAD(P)-dependent oxidoreductase [Alphaproteobacteria bacterium]